jgi:membrane associated rhomboid family serine protease
MERLEEDKQLLKSSLILAAFVLFLPWITFVLELGMDTKFTSMGILPKQSKGLLGILTSWLVHGDLKHLLSNSLLLFTGVTLLFYHYRDIAFKALTYLLVLTGIWVWIFARPTFYHIGASGLVYALSSFLIFSGVFRRDRRLMAVSLLVVFLHSGILYGLLPMVEKISHEAHISGFVTGIIFAYWFVIRDEEPLQSPYSDKVVLDEYWKNTDTTFQSEQEMKYKYIEKED